MRAERKFKMDNEAARRTDLYCVCVQRWSACEVVELGVGRGKGKKQLFSQYLTQYLSFISFNVPHIPSSYFTFNSVIYCTSVSQIQDL